MIEFFELMWQYIILFFTDLKTFLRTMVYLFLFCIVSAIVIGSDVNKYASPDVDD